MPKNKIHCFSAGRICHHDDYFLVINCICPAVNLKDKKEKLNVLFSKSPIVFLDIDGDDLKYTLIILLRSLWGGRGLGISVRTEYLLEKKTFMEFLLKRGRHIFVKAVVKRFLFLAIKKLSSTSIVSIHKNNPKRDGMEPFVSDFINDPQLWDLGILNIAPGVPNEWNNFKFIEKRKLVLVAGRLNEQRSKMDLIDYILQSEKFNFLICGNIEDDDFKQLEVATNCFVINRYISNEELLFLYNECDIFYCFYSNDRPSGFFGRAVQMSKLIIVREGQFLHSTFSSYEGLIPVKRLIDLDKYKIEFDHPGKEFLKNLDDREKLSKILKRL